MREIRFNCQGTQARQTPNWRWALCVSILKSYFPNRCAAVKGSVALWQRQEHFCQVPSHIFILLSASGEWSQWWEGKICRNIRNIVYLCWDILKLQVWLCSSHFSTTVCMCPQGPQRVSVPFTGLCMFMRLYGAARTGVFMVTEITAPSFILI